MSDLTVSSPTVLLTRLAWSTFRRLKPELLGMKLKEYFALRQLSDEGHMSQASLCSGMNVDANYMTLMLNDLEAAGWVERRRDPSDRRAWQLFLTDKSKPILDDLRRMADDLFVQVLSGLDDGERSALGKSLGRMRANLLDLPSPRTTETAHG